MFLSTIVTLLTATAAIAAPADFESVTSRAACSKTQQLFTNGAFNNNVRVPWYTTGQAGVGSVVSGIQYQYYPKYYPNDNGPSAFFVTFNVPAGQTKSIRLEQKIDAGIVNWGFYNMTNAIWLQGTTSASCTAVRYAGTFPSNPQPPLVMKLPAVRADYPAGNFFFATTGQGVDGKNDPVSAANNVAGTEYRCTAGAENAVINIYVDDMSLYNTCN